MKKGFGLLEVLVAALVLGFLIVGLNNLQMGNREAILRIRARDAANIIAQHVLDSLGAVGVNSLPEEGKIIDKEERYYVFKGKVLEGSAVESTMKFTVDVDYLPSSSGDETNIIDKEIDETTDLNSMQIKNTFAKNIQAIVSWDFKGSTQSIRMSKVVR